jgi:hypothetical protein
MWEEEFFGMDAPSLRDVTAIAASIAGKFIPGADFVDDLLFAGLDITHGYKSVGEVAQSLGEKMIITAVTAGVGLAFDGLDTIINGVTEKLGTTGKFLADIGVNSAKKYLTDVGLGYFKAGWSQNWDEANSIWTDKDTISGAITGGISKTFNDTFENVFNNDDHTFATAVKKMGITAAETYALQVAGGYIENMDFTKIGQSGWFNSGKAKESWYSDETIKATVTSGVKTGISEFSGYLSYLNDNKFADGSMMHTLVNSGIAIGDTYAQGFTERLIKSINFSKIFQNDFINTGEVNKLWLDNGIVSNSLQAGAVLWINKGASDLTK